MEETHRVEMVTAIEALRVAMDTKGTSRGAVASLCSERFGKEKFSELRDSQQWTLVCEIDPQAIGPYGYTMEPI